MPRDRGIRDVYPKLNFPFPNFKVQNCDINNLEFVRYSVLSLAWALTSKNIVWEPERRGWRMEEEDEEGEEGTYFKINMSGIVV